MSTTHSTQAGFSHIIPIVLIVAVVSAVGLRVYVAHTDKPQNLQTSQVTTKALPDDLSSVLTLDELKQLAVAEKPGATIAALELEQEDGTLVYQLRLSDGTVVAFNAITGKKVTLSSNSVEQTENALPANFKPSIDFVKAREIAVSKRPGVKVSKIELEVEEGKVVYSVRFLDKSRVDVDANSGAVVRLKVPNKPESATGGGSSSGSGRSDDRSSNTSGSGSGSSGSRDSSGSSNSGSGSSGSGDDSSGHDSSHDSNDDNGGDDDNDDDNDDDDSSGSNSGSGSRNSGSDDN